MARELIVSPKGEALWAKVLGSPTAFREGEPRAWSTSLLLDPSAPDVQALIQRLKDEATRLHGADATLAPNGWPVTEDSSGKLRLNFKRKELTARGEPKNPPPVVDDRKNLWPVDQRIANGRPIKVAFCCWGWEIDGGYGMSLELESVQVLPSEGVLQPVGADVFDVEA